MQALSFVGTLTSLMGNRGNKRTVTPAPQVAEREKAPTVETIPYEENLAKEQRLLARNSKEKPTTATTSSGISISKEVT